MNKLTDELKSAKAKSVQTGKAAKAKATQALGKSRDAAARGVNSSKQLASKAAAKTGDTIDKNPLAIVLGGLALGAIVGALIPKTGREKKLLGKQGRKINDRIKQASDAAKTAGKGKIDELGLNQDAVREQFRDLVSKAAETVKAAGKAAGDAARNRD